MDEIEIKSKVMLTEKEIGKIIDLCIEGLYTDGSHHKQYYIERILQVVLAKKSELKKVRNFPDYEKGIAP